MQASDTAPKMLFGLATSQVGVLRMESGLLTQLLLLLKHICKAAVTIRALGSFLPMGDSCDGFLQPHRPDLAPVAIGIWEVPLSGRTFSFCLSLCPSLLSNKQKQI